MLHHVGMFLFPPSCSKVAMRPFCNFLLKVLKSISLDEITDWFLDVSGIPELGMQEVCSSIGDVSACIVTLCGVSRKCESTSMQSRRVFLNRSQSCPYLPCSDTLGSAKAGNRHSSALDHMRRVVRCHEHKVERANIQCI